MVYARTHALTHKEILTHATTWMNLENIMHRKPDTKSHIQHDSVYTKCPQQASPQRQKVDGRRREEESIGREGVSS